MEYDDLRAAPQARANRLRDQIEKLKSGSAGKPTVVKTPRQFVEEKSREQLQKEARSRKKH